MFVCTKVAIFYKESSKVFRKYFSQRNSKTELHRANIMARGLPAKKPINGVKYIVLVSSGKGGVGKSTTSVNLATALKFICPDKSVGLLDTDVFGPSVPLMMNLHDSPLVNDDDLIVPLTNYGVKCMSMGFLIEEGSPVIWRGLMVMQALDKLLRKVAWGEVDFLIIDTPPGTGDTLLSLIQNIPISGVILVTTPQLAALQVTQRGAAMYQKLQVPIIGVVENMGSVSCNSCNSQIKIFGEGTSKLVKEISSNMLESFPLSEELSSCSDRGLPVVIKNSSSTAAKSYINLARKVVKYLANKHE